MIWIKERLMSIWLISSNDPENKKCALHAFFVIITFFIKLMRDVWRPT
ncbi:MAG: hypothetical protein RL536_601, partial [Candidatus Parcubacteria bacterium]